MPTRLERLSKEWQENPGIIPLNSLPVELIHNICSYLEYTEDVPNFRLACKVFGAVGAEYLLEELHVINKRSVLQRALEISENHSVCKNICSLYYEADMLEPKSSFEAWNRDKMVETTWGSLPLDPTPITTIGDGLTLTGRSQRALSRAIKKDQLEKEQNERGLSKSKLLEAYKRYQEYVSDQESIFEEGFDLKCFETYFRKCYNINQIYVSIGGGTRGRTDMNRHAFRDAMAYPFGDHTKANGVRQVSNVLRAAYRAGIALKYIWVEDVSYRFFLQDEDTMTEIKNALMSLSEFTMDISTPWADDYGNIDAVEMQQAIATSERGYFHNVLTAMPRLRKLDLSLPKGDHLSDCITLGSLVGNHTFERLGSIRLFDFNTTEDELKDFLMRHKNTLCFIYFNDVTLTAGAASIFFRAISRQLPRLKRIRLSGDFASSGDLWNFGVPHMDRATRVAWAMDRYVRKGGPLPGTDEAIAFHVPDPINHGKPGVGDEDRIDDPEFDQDEPDVEPEEWESIDDEEDLDQELYGLSDDTDEEEDSDF